MGFQSLTMIGQGMGFDSGQPATLPDLKSCLGELRGLTPALLTNGANSGVAVSLAGFSADDVPAFGIGWNSTGAPSAVVPGASIANTLAANNIVISANDLSGLASVVFFYKKPWNQ